MRRSLYIVLFSGVPEGQAAVVGATSLLISSVIGRPKEIYIYFAKTKELLRLIAITSEIVMSCLDAYSLQCFSKSSAS